MRRVKSKYKKVLKLRKVTIWTLFIVLGICCFFFYYYVMIPRIGFFGPTVVRIGYKEKYEDSGYWAGYRGRDITSKVQVKGNVNSSKLGKYVITYQVKYFGMTKTKKRTVIVEDKKKPALVFDGGNDLYLCPKQDYDKDDYTAIDNYDGDLTDKVLVKRNGSYMQYTVTDQFGNETIKSRKIIMKDIQPPNIKLKGDAVISLLVGDSYIEPSYEAIDNCDGNLTSKVKVTGSVDTSVAGEYTLVYSVKDKSLNQAKIERKVIVVEPEQPGMIYLTFDDGPRLGTTDVILDILKEEGIKATFFVTNNGPDELILREYQEGHTVALHTACHDYSILYASSDAYFADLYAVQERVKRITGQESKIIRFPGGSSNTVSRKYSPGIMSYLTKEVLQRGFRYYDWNINSMDAEGKKMTPSELASKVTSKLSRERANMVLMHDIKPTTRDALREIIQYGKQNGYYFANITMATEMVVQRVNN